ncbi:MAG: hypothetical protein LBP59_10765 [Planctomycetaceae bacterium]|jgi:hypothetical protein|nr:hypothetical protein [Planctomycetaceae bacterium]
MTETDETIVCAKIAAHLEKIAWYGKHKIAKIKPLIEFIHNLHTETIGLIEYENETELQNRIDRWLYEIDIDTEWLENRSKRFQMYNEILEKLDNKNLSR